MNGKLSRLIVFTLLAAVALPLLASSGDALAAGGGEAHGAGHAAGSRPADEDHHWWIGKALPVGLRQGVADMIGPSLMGEPSTNLNVGHLFMGVLVFFVGVGMALSARKKVLESQGRPPAKWGAFAFFDILMEAILGLMTNMMPRERALRFLPLVTAAAVFILISNLLGLVPGFVPPTQNLNTTLALGIIAFVYYNYQGIRQVGLLKYLKHFLGPLLPLAPLILVIEIISHCVRPLSLGLRLMGNMFGDHQVLFIFMSFGLPLIPLPLMALGLMVCIVQTVVFTLLFIVYLSLATEDHDHGHEEHGEGHHAAPAHAH
ncbi:MAG: F0F1 ATP synthase subunit A [Deltaproteobacteria bacterium]|nr:F0F1 ATP synthase subunit A [Deltaproteobacteria bacterium]